jgi:nitroreductase
MENTHQQTTARPLPKYDLGADDAPPTDELAEFTRALIASRQNVSPKRLVAPGPDAAHLQCLLEAAAAAPDHDQRLPWRFVIVPAEKRGLLGQAFALALIDRDPGATVAAIEAAREKAQRAPLLMLAIASLAPDDGGIPGVERVVSLGCAIQNMLLTAHSLGYGAGLTSGQALGSRRLRELFALTAGEEAVCFVNVGTVTRRKPMRTRPANEMFASTL